MDESHDLAILQVSVPDAQSLPLGDSDTVEIGDTVYAAGNPKGYFEGTFSSGIISGIRGDSTNKRLQMTAPVSSGSSGGPVVNGRGQVIGVSFATFRGGQNLNFAIPSNYLKELLAQLGPTKPLSREKQSPPSESDDNKGALADYDKAIRLNPNDAEAYLNRGMAYNKIGQYFAAIIDYDTAIRLKPDYAMAYYKRGVAKAGLGQHFAAIADFDTAIRFKPDDLVAYAAYAGRGLVKVKLGQYFAAITDFDTAIRLKSDDPGAYAGRGVAKHKLGRTREGRRDFQTALKLAERAGAEDLKVIIEKSIRDSR